MPSPSIGDQIAADARQGGSGAILHAESPYGGDVAGTSTVQALFDAQVARTPERTAVVCRGRRLSYRELGEAAGALGRHLAGAHGLGPERLAAVMMGRSEQLLVALMGVMQAAAAFVPIEPDQPDARVALMLNDCGARVLITDRAHEARARGIAGAAGTGVQVLVLDGDAPPTPQVQPRLAVSQSRHLAYVIYTSGSTGNPKGVEVEQRALANYVLNVRDHLGLSAGEVCDLSTSIGFDLTLTTTLACLCLGGCVAVFPHSLREIDLYRAHLAQDGVTFLKLTPSYFGLIAEGLGETSVRTVVLGGEKLGRELLDRVRPPAGAALRIFDEYGPTESTVGVCHSQVFPVPEAGIDIGVFYDGCFGQVVGEDGREAPVGAPGELLVGGVCLARGYLGRPELTAERFIGAGAERLYRTGDLVRRREGGRLEFIGRADDQVKIRGFRVEPGEIEAVLARHGDVVQAAVLHERTSAGEGLAAYLKPGEFGCSAEELELFVEPLLPEHMRPRRYVFLDELPLTANGKVDRAALACLAPDADGACAAPATELERRVLEVWTGLMGGERQIGVEDRFLSLGGDSITAIQLIGRLRQALGVQVAVADVFEHQTIRGFCAHLEAGVGEALGVPAVAAPTSGSFGLLPIQQWFFDRRTPAPGHWNQAFLIRTPRLEAARLAHAVEALVGRHPALGLRFGADASGRVLQAYSADAAPPALKVLDLADVADAAALWDRLTAWQDGFDLASGPLVSIGYVHGFSDGSARVHIAAHHLVIDAVSWRILTEDLEALYEGAEAAPSTADYRQWVEAVARYPAAHPEEAAFWALDPRPCRLRIGSEAVAQRTGFTLSAEDTRRLVVEGRRPYNTQINDLLLAAFGEALRMLTGEAVQDVVLEGHGREPIEPGLDVSRTVGWFTSLFPVRLTLGSDLLASLVSVKETLRALPNRGVGYGAIHGYDTRHLPRICFNYLGQFEASHGAWRILDEDAGQALDADDRDANLVTISGRVSEGRLAFSLVSRLPEVDAESLTAGFQAALERLAAMTAGAERCWLTPSDVGGVVSAARLDELQRDGEIEAVHRAGSLQQGFIHHAMAGAADGAYVVQARWSYSHPIDPARLERAWRQAQKTFPTLRLRFDWLEVPVQVVDRRQPLDWRTLDLGDLGLADQEERLDRLMQADRAEGFDLARGALFRIYLVRRREGAFTCLFSHHHAILDGWSVTLLLDAVHGLYADPRLAERVPDDAYLKVQDHLRTHHADDARLWAAEVAAYEDRLGLEDLIPAGGRSEAGETGFRLNGRDLERLQRFAADRGVTLNAALLWAWHKVLAVFGGRGQTATGLVVSGRTWPVAGVEGAVGLLINTLPSIATHAVDEEVADALGTLQRHISLANDRCAVDLAALSEGGGRLFDTLFIYENWPGIAAQGWAADLGVAFEGQAERYDYPLVLVASETAEALAVRLVHADAAFDAGQVGRMAELLGSLLRQMASAAPRRWTDFTLAPPEAPGPAEAAAKPGVFHQRVRSQAVLTPDRTAVSSGERSLTYKALDEASDRLAALLISEAGVRPEDRVALCLDRNLDIVVAILAVMKTGGAYVPIDPDHPRERLALILKDVEATAVLTHAAHRGLFPPGHRLFALDDAVCRQALARQGPVVLPTLGPDNLAYVIHTSGSTGRPKGVMVEHAAFCRTVDAVRRRLFAPGAALDTVSLTNPIFDIFGLEYALPLLSGGHVRIAEDLPETLVCDGFDFLQATPSLLGVLLDRLADASGTLLLCGGEPLTPELLGRAMARGIDLANLYGPTETAIWSTARLYRAGKDEVLAWVDLGSALDGERVLVLDAALRPVPAGAVGELCIAGTGLARGYLGSPELTAERFVQAPAGMGGGRLYRTGDIVRRRTDGGLEFLRRNDAQIKLRGRRIEPGEIEAAIAAVPGVVQSAVAVRGEVLVGYYAASEGLDAGGLADHLYRTLPAHLIPAALVRLERLPLTPSGKLDRRALPPPPSQAHAIVPPRSPHEVRVRACWARCLDLDEASIGIDDDFFALGGDSLCVLRLWAELRRDLGVGVDLGVLQAHRTVRRLGDALQGLAPGQDTGVAESLTDGPAPLSFAQQRIWIAEGLSRGSAAYNIPLVVELVPETDAAALAGALHDLVRRHETLRTTFGETADGAIVQAVRPARPVRLAPVTVPDAAALEARILRDAHRPFDLGRVPFRARLYRQEDTGTRRLGLTLHHIAFDGWSIDVLLGDLVAFYRRREAMARGGAAPLAPPALAMTYRQHAARECAELTQARLEEGLGFWRGYLEGFQTLRLPADRPRPEVPDYQGRTLRVELDAVVSEGLRGLARKLRVSLFSVLAGAVFLTLRAFAGQDDVVIGAPFGNRRHPAAGQLVGVFVNALPLRARIDPEVLVSDFIQAVAHDIQQALAHQDTPFEAIVEAMAEAGELVPDRSRHPIYQTLFDVQSFGRAFRDPGAPMRLASKPWEHVTAAKHDLGVFVDDSGERLEVFVNHAVSVLDARTAASLAETYGEVLRQFAGLNGDLAALWRTTLRDLRHLPVQALGRLVQASAPASAAPAARDSLCAGFEAQVRARGDAVAVAFEGMELSYRELDDRSGGLARRLCEAHGVRTGDRVALCLDRGVDQVVAILAVLKCGAAYVPIEPASPDRRIGFMIADSEARTVLTQARLAGRLGALLGPGAPAVLAIDASELLARLKERPADPPAAAGTPAYVVYTSGSSGEPKGVVQTHGNVLDLFAATRVHCQVGEADVWPMVHSYAFDFSVWEVWGALLHGGRLEIASEEDVRDPERLHRLCRDASVTVLNQTPAAFAGFLRVALVRDPRELRALRYLLVGGERWDVGILRDWFAHFGAGPEVLHVYGPTETTVFATMRPIAPAVGGIDPSLGPPLLNMSAYVVDPELRLLPAGAIGELCLGGAGLAPGYLHREALSHERFVANPFQTEADRLCLDEGPPGRNARLYRTGDLVRRTPEGWLTFVERNDLQVKLRGYRIELGEIEAAITAFPGVGLAAAVVRTDDPGRAGEQLAAYYVVTGPVDPGALRAHLVERLPAFMTPSSLTALERMPLGPTGKIDRRALPPPEARPAQRRVEPRDDRERLIRRLYAEVLELDEDGLSVEANFFALGGDSLKSIRLVSRINRACGGRMGIASLFRFPSIAALAAQIEPTAGEEPPIPRHRPADPTRQVLSFAQERLWFVDQYERGTSAYNIGLSYGLCEDADLSAVELSLKAVYARHEALRTLLRYGAAGPWQLVLDAREHPLEVERIPAADERALDARLAGDIERVMDLGTEVPFKARLYETPAGAYLALVIHHSAFDGWSVELLLAELEAFYRHHADPSPERPPPAVPELAVQYGDFAAWEQRRRLADGIAASDLDYWKGRLKGFQPLNLPADRPRPLTTRYEGADVRFELDEAVTAGLRRLAAELEVSLFSLLLTAYYLMLRTFSGQNDLVVGVPVANRAHSQVESLIGCFLNTLALDIRIEGGEPVGELVRAVATRINAGRQHQQLPFERLVAELALPVDPSRHPVFQVTFDVNSFVRAHLTGRGGCGAGLLRFHRPEQGASLSAKFDLSAFIDDGGDRLEATFTYAVSLFDRSTIEGFAETYRLILAQLAVGGGAGRAGDLVLTTGEQAALLDGWAEGPIEPRPATTVLDLIEAQARRAPQRTAALFEDQALTYAELNGRADRLAQALRAWGVGLEDVVVLCLERSETIAVAILAVWKAGGAYAPVDPEFPDGRIGYILGDTRARVLICDLVHRDRCEALAGQGGTRVMAIDAAALVDPLPDAQVPPGARPGPASLAYVIYTSGTSGGPKGVMIEHGSLANLQADQTRRYGIGRDGDEVILQVSNYIFDASVEQLVLALPNGHALLFTPNRLWLEGARFRDYLCRHGVTHISATPTFLTQIEVGPLPTLRRYVVGGEALDPACHRRIVDANPVDVFNQYGPTEITVTAVGQRVSAENLSIGRPMANVKALVLSPEGQLLPPGAVGELHIAGAGVGRGYLDKPELTAAAFLPNPFQTEAERRDGRNARLYRTGDLVRWRNERLDYVGRADQQVKIRGHRIELGEINAVLGCQPGIGRSVVIATTTSGAQIAAYYTSDQPLDEGELLRALKHALPAYMIPGRLIRLDQIPMTAHGKLDLDLLPRPRRARSRRAAEVLTPLETRIRQAWSEVLELDEADLSADEDFFDIGGNSVLTVQLVTRLKRLVPDRFAIADAFVHRTVRAQAAHALTGREANCEAGIVRLNGPSAGPALFMIHPAHAGCEVYASLARRLEGRFQCFGLESHNLRGEAPITSLPELADLYLERIEAARLARGELMLRLMGWSLGGQIALEIAAQMEARGHRDIEVCLLDSVLPDAALVALAAGASLEDERLSHRRRLERQGHGKDLIETVLANYPTDAALAVQGLSAGLAWTRVLLFKALARDPLDATNTPALHEHVAGLAFNNLDQIHADVGRLGKVELADACHFDVLGREDEILPAFLAWASPPAAPAE